MSKGDVVVKPEHREAAWYAVNDDPVLHDNSPAKLWALHGGEPHGFKFGDVERVALAIATAASNAVKPWELLAAAPGLDVEIGHSCCDGLHEPGGKVRLNVSDGLPNGNTCWADTATEAARDLCVKLGLLP